MKKYQLKTDNTVQLTAIIFPFDPQCAVFEIPTKFGKEHFPVMKDGCGMPVIYILSEIGGNVVVNGGDYVIVDSHERCSPALFNSLFQEC